MFEGAYRGPGSQGVSLQIKSSIGHFALDPLRTTLQKSKYLKTLDFLGGLLYTPPAMELLSLY